MTTPPRTILITISTSVFLRVGDYLPQLVFILGKERVIVRGSVDTHPTFLERGKLINQVSVLFALACCLTVQGLIVLDTTRWTWIFSPYR